MCFGLEVAPGRLDELYSSLSADERARAQRPLFESLRSRFIVARGRLREMLGARLGIPASEVRFRYGPNGKPELDGEAASTGLKFNLSHSGYLALVGFSTGREVGVDIEFWRHLRDEEALARRHFAPSEFADYLSLAPAVRTEGFFNGWTRKEAFIKALGRGLSLPLSSFEVELRPGRVAVLRSWRRENEDSREWSLAALALPARCAAAVVIEGDGCHIMVAERTSA